MIALVTGASRGVGKGIALALGDAGATVYVSGRSTRTDGPSGPLPGTIEDTAEEVTRRGGHGIPVRCDHRDDDAVRGLIARIDAQQDRLDLLVNAVWGGYEWLHEGRYEAFGAPFWQQEESLWDDMFAAGVRAYYVTCRLAVPLLQPGGLIVNISSFAAASQKENVALGVAKAATDRMSALMSAQLGDRDVAVVSLYPGLVRTEGILKWADYIDLSNSESPWFVGRAVVALATDEQVLERSGQTLVAAELAEEYGFTDEDGAQPRSLRSDFEEVR